MSSDEYLSSKDRIFKHLQLPGIYHAFKTETETFTSSADLLVEFKFLDIFVRVQSFTDDPSMLDLTQEVQALFQDAAVNFSEFRIPEYSDSCTSDVQNRICTSKVKIRAKCSFPKISLPLSANIIAKYSDACTFVQNRICTSKVQIRARYSFPKVSLPLSANKEGVAVPRFVLGFIKTVVENLRCLVCTLYVPPKTMEQIEKVLKELRLLKSFVWFVSERIIEPLSQHHINFLNHVLAVVGHASMLAWLYLPDCKSRSQDLAPQEIDSLFSDFLRMRIKPIQPHTRKIYVDVLQALKPQMRSGCYPNIQSEHAIDIETGFLGIVRHNLVELPTNSNSSQRVALKDHLEMLQKMINLWRPNIFYVQLQDLEVILRDIDTLIIDAGLLVYSLYEGEEDTVDMVPREVNPTQVLTLLGNIQRISTVAYPIIRKGFQSNLPRIHGLGYVDFLLNNLKEFQRRYPDSPTPVMNQLQIIQKLLESFQPFLKAVAEEQYNDLDKTRRCATQLIAKAYEVEYIVDAYISKKAPVWCLERWFLDIVNEITLIREEVAEVHEKKMVDDSLDKEATHTPSNLEKTPSPLNEEIVGFTDVIEKLRDQLIKGTRRRDVISIVGMPGLGKTTLANRLYSDGLVCSHFDVRAQCCVSQVYSRENLLLTILRDAIGKDSKHGRNNAGELADELRKALIDKRYLVLVDDVWETSVWDDLIGCFQENNKGSRIILTTRNHDVANYVKLESDPLQLRMFNNDESWQLLRKIVFEGKSCPLTLRDIGRQIAEKCGRIPLSVSLVAGFLKKERKEECWKQVADHLGPHILKDSRAIIEHSYQNLPYHLRPCFLYFGAFLEDSAISVSKLTRLWISEGFVKSCEGKSLEDIAEGYLENLIRRNLVMVANTSSGGKLKACRVHDLLYDFCKERANEENLLLLIKRDKNDYPAGDVYSHKQPAHRLSIFGDVRYRSKELNYCWSLVFSVIAHGECLTKDQVFNIIHNFKFLKVLDLESIRIHSIPTELVYLRYFSAVTWISIPSSIANLWNLETLIWRNWLGKSSLPITLWEMVKLRHLHICRDGFVIENADELRTSSAILYDLKTLSVAYFSCVDEAELVLGKTPNLQKLSCEFMNVGDFQDHVLNFPTQLEMLKIRGEFRKVIFFHISAPNLRSLRLTRFHLVPHHLSNIGLLENLQVLKLCSIDFDDEWKVSDDEFPQLKVLKLQLGDSLREWTISDGGFPNLERLFMQYCKSLKEIPSCFEDHCSLKSIEVRDCNESLAKSARDTWKTRVEDYGHSDFEVFINGRAVVNSDSVGSDGDDDDDDDDNELEEEDEDWRIQF